MAKKPAVYIIKKTSQRGSESYIQGNLEQLKEFFSGTLRSGNSLNSKISNNPKSIAALISNVSKSQSELEAACYNRSSISLCQVIPEGARVHVYSQD